MGRQRLSSSGPAAAITGGTCTFGEAFRHSFVRDESREDLCRYRKNRLGTSLPIMAAAEVLMADSVPPVQSQVQTEADAQTRFVQLHLRRIFLLIYRIVGNVDDAQDLAQETFIKALQRQVS